jgi:hypothetical protein
MRTEFHSESPKGRETERQKYKYDDNIKVDMVWKGTTFKWGSAVSCCDIGNEPLFFLISKKF